MEEINNHDVYIYGYQEKFAFDVKTTVYKDGELLGTILPGENIKIGVIDKDTHLLFKAGFRKREIKIEKGYRKDIQLSFNRFSGKLNAIETEDIELTRNKMHKKDNKILWGVIIGYFVFVVFFFLVLGVIIV